MKAGRPSFTARWVAAQRARLDDQRPTLPTGDPAAEAALYQGLGRVLGAPLFSPTRMTARTAFFDRETVAAIERGLTQIVIVGAGYDGRSARFAHPGVRWFEVDHPATQADKRRRFGTEWATLVPVDLVVDDVDAALERAGHDARRPSLFMCEGLFAYLTMDDGVALLASLRGRAAAGSVVAANFLVTQRRRPALDVGLAVIGEPRRARFAPADPGRMLGRSGWVVAAEEETARNTEYLVTITGRAL